MGLRGVVKTVTNDPIQRLAGTLAEVADDLHRLRSVVRRDCLKARGYELEYRTLPTPGLYLVNKRDTDPNFNTATFLGP